LALVVAAVSAPWVAEISVPGETGLGEEGIAVDTTTNRVFITNAVNNTVVVLQDGATPTYDTSVAVGLAPQGIDVNPVTQKVYVGNTGSATITVLQATSPYSTVTTITP
jgi:DNA-binding beta-propeller fold protein YncE